MMSRRCGWKKCCPVAWDRPGRSGHFAIPRGATVPTVPHGPPGWDTENGVFPDAAPATVPTVPPFGPVRSSERTRWTLAKQPRHPHTPSFVALRLDCRDLATAKTRGGTYRGPGPRLMRSESSRIFCRIPKQRDRLARSKFAVPLKGGRPTACCATLRSKASVYLGSGADAARRLAGNSCGPTPNASQAGDTASACAKASTVATVGTDVPLSVLRTAVSVRPASRARARMVKPRS